MRIPTRKVIEKIKPVDNDVYAEYGLERLFLHQISSNVTVGSYFEHPDAQFLKDKSPEYFKDWELTSIKFKKKSPGGGVYLPTFKL